MRHLSRCLLCAFVCLSVLFSTSLCVYAVDNEDLDISLVTDEKSGVFNGNEVPLYNAMSPSIIATDEINGFKVTTYWDTVEFDSYYQTESGVHKVGVKVELPENIKSKSIFNIYMKGNVSGISQLDTVIHFEGFSPSGQSVGGGTFNMNSPTSKWSAQGKDLQFNDTITAIYFEITAVTGNTGILFDIDFVEIEETSTSGLLGGILEWLQGIFDGITELPSKIASSISGFFTWIVDAVNNMKNAITTALTNLGNFIIDGIKGLFIPTEQDITSVKEDWDNLLENRFGGLYQSIEIVHDMYEGFTQQEKKTITVPQLQIPFGDAVWTFGGWEVQIVPDGFSVLIEACKTAISIVCTLSFIQGLKNRFERLIGGQNA